MKRADTVILAAGDRPSHPIPLSMLRCAKRLIACDGAWRTAVALGRKPDAVVGDGDSLAPGDAAALGSLGVFAVQESEQDTNDLAKAFRYACASGDAACIAILGATGGREDHTIGNVFHLMDFAERHRDVAIVTDSGTFEPLPPPGIDRQDESLAGRPISIFAPCPGTSMKSKGLVWPLDGVTFDQLWRGTLNRISSSRFSISTNRMAVVFIPHPA